MKCGRIECTGIHDTHRAWSTICEATKERQRERQRQLRVTPGTYRYKEAHREGRPGLVDYVASRTRQLLRQRGRVHAELLKANQVIEELEGRNKWIAIRN